MAQDDDTSPANLPANIKPIANKRENGNDGAKMEAASTAPVKLEEWKEQDFLNARDQGDARLISAVDERRNTRAGQAKKRKCWRRFVKRQPQDGSEALAAPARGALVRAVTAALAANNTAAAGKSLCDLFATEFSGVERLSTADIVLTALLRRDSPENEQAVLKILTANLPTAGKAQDEQQSDSLRQKMVAIVRTNGSRGCERCWQMRFWSKPFPPCRANSIYPCYASRIR